MQASYGLWAYYCDSCGKTGIVRDGEDEKKRKREEEEERVPTAHLNSPQNVSMLEERFLKAWETYNRLEIPRPVREYHFATPRKFRFDFAWPDAYIAVECEGIDHRKVQRYHKDIEKYNLAAQCGWRVFRCTARLMRDAPEEFVNAVAATIFFSLPTRREVNEAGSERRRRRRPAPPRSPL